MEETGWPPDWGVSQVRCHLSPCLCESGHQTLTTQTTAECSIDTFPSQTLPFAQLFPSRPSLRPKAPTRGERPALSLESERRCDCGCRRWSHARSRAAWAIGCLWAQQEVFTVGVQFGQDGMNFKILYWPTLLPYTRWRGLAQLEPTKAAVEQGGGRYSWKGGNTRRHQGHRECGG